MTVLAAPAETSVGLLVIALIIALSPPKLR